MLNNTDIPLTAIRVFVTIGRHGSFTKAAAALGITQSAVSRHVASLEKLAGTKLFIRKGPLISLTPFGSQFYETVKDEIATIELAVQQMFHTRHKTNRLTVCTSMPSFAMNVVVPMLGAFMAETALRVDLITTLSPPGPNDVFDILISRDLCIPNAENWELIQENLVCVGASSLIKKYEQLPPAEWPIITSKSRPDTLTTWAIANGISIDELQVLTMYDHIFLAVAATIGGTGLLIVPQILVLDQLRAGTLGVLGEQHVSSGATYFAYLHTQTLLVQEGRTFCRWLKRMLKIKIDDFEQQEALRIQH